MCYQPEDGGEYYDDGGGYSDNFEGDYYYEGGSGDIIKAASEVYIAVRQAAGHELKTHGEWISNVKFNDGMVIDAVSDMCTGMMSAVVKRMGYYLPSHGKKYSATYQGDIGMTPTIGTVSWGLNNADGHPNIYDRNGNKSQDWIIVKDGSHQPGDLSFACLSSNAVHGHIPVFQNNSGYWFGFNGGRWDSRANSIRLGEYYMSHGSLPPKTNKGVQSESNKYDQQIGAVAYPMSYNIRYVGPKTGGSMRRVTTGTTASATRSRGGRSASSSGGGAVIGDFKSRTTRPEAGNKYYIRRDSGGWSPAIKGNPRDPDCDVLANCVGYAMGRYFEIQGDQNFTKAMNANGGTPIYKDAIAKGFQTSTTPELGAMIVWNHPGGGGHVGIVENIAADGSIDISQSGYGSYVFKYNTYKKESNYSNSSNKLVGFILQPRKYTQSYTDQVASSTRAASRRGRTASSYNNTSASTVRTGGNVVGGNKALTAASETLLAMKKAYDANGLTDSSHGIQIKNVRFDDGQVIDTISAMCTGTQAAIVRRMGYQLKNVGMTSSDAWGLRNKDGIPNIYDSNGNKSSDWKIVNDGSYQPGDISFPSSVMRKNVDPVHAHMGAFKYGGSWYGFNGTNPKKASGTPNQLHTRNIAEYYLKYGKMPDENSVTKADFNKNFSGAHPAGNYQDGTAGPVLRYVGPQTSTVTYTTTGGTSTRSRGRTSSSAGTVSYSTGPTATAMGSKEDWIRTVAMMFEGYMNSGQHSYDGKHKYYDASHVHNNIKLRNGKTVQMRPDCSGTLGSSITAFGYKFVSPSGPPAGWHDDVAGCHTYGAAGRKQYANWKSGWHPPYIANADGSPTNDWAFYKTADTPIQPGDIVAWENDKHNGKKTRHATFAVSGSGTSWRGMDAGGDSNLQESAKVAKEYLDTGTTNWRGISVSGMENILRYVGAGGSSGGYYSTSSAGGTTASTRRGRTSGGTATSRTSSSGNSRTRGRTRTTATTTARTVNPSAPLSGSSNAEKVFNYLTTNKGMSAVGAAGMMGCFKHESNFQSNNLEDSFQAKWGYASGTSGDAKYTSDVNSGKESEYNFVHSRGTNRAGYGIPQFTATNVKQDLYNRTVKQGKSIDSIDSQLDSIMVSLSNAKFKGTTLANAISSASTPTEANQYFLWRYEAGTGYNSDAAVNRAYGGDISTKRHKAAEEYYRLYGSGDEYVPSVFDTEQFNPSPIVQFMNTPQQGDLIYPDINEDIPYQPLNGPMIIPALDANNNLPMMYDYDEEQPVIINQVNYVSETEELMNHIGEISTMDYNIQSAAIRGLVNEINDELPEYMDWYFSDEDGYSDEEFTEEDDMEILQMAAAFL